MELQLCLQDNNLWDTAMPSQQALQSQQPFCIDTMSFEQWLRYVMIERFKLMLAEGAELPTRCHISPMAEEAYKDSSHVDLANLMRCLDRIDQHLSRSE